MKLISIILLAILFYPVVAQTETNPPICPAWAFEPWVWEDNINTQETIEGIVENYLNRDIPVGAVIIDSPWSTFYNDFSWDLSLYPTPQEMIDNFQSQNVNVVMWMTGFVNTDCPDYQYVIDNGFAVDDGTVYTWWKGDGVHLDFTNADAMAWLGAKLDELHANNIRGWKVDQGVDYLNDNVKTSIGTITKQEFKDYFYKSMYDYAVGNSTENITIARAYSFQGGLGAPVESSPISWLGDFSGNFSGISGQLSDLYTSADYGYSAPGIEVGGFQGAVPTKSSLIRYAQFGALTPLMLNGGSNGGVAEHLPWYWDEETVDIYRYYATLHSELVPFFFSNSVKAHLGGGSIIKNPDGNLAQHQLGDEIFTSILTNNVTIKEVQIPEAGNWIDYWDESNVYSPGVMINYITPLDKYPIFIKTGSVIPLSVRNNVTDHGNSSQEDKLTLLIYPDGENTTTHYIPLGNGIEYATLNIVVDESNGTVEVNSDTELDFHLLIKSFVQPEIVSNADSWSYDETMQYIDIDKSGSTFTLQIDNISAYQDIELLTEYISDNSDQNLKVYDEDNAIYWSVQENVQVGDLQYADRDYTFISIPDELLGSTWIKTANGSKLYAEDTLAIYIAPEDMDVYVAHKDDISNKPEWLSKYTDTQQKVVNSESLNKNLTLFVNTVSKGDTIFMGNNGSDNGQGMYSVFMVESNVSTDLYSNKVINKLYVNAYPNPFTDVVNFELYVDRVTDVTISLFNNTGQLMARKICNQLSLGKQEVSMHLNNLGIELSNGIYLYQVSTDKHTVNGKLIKQ